MPIPHLTDTVQLNDPHAGNANAGNGGDGISHGDINYNPTVSFDASQEVSGAEVNVHNGDHFSQHGDWDAGGGGAGGGGVGGPAVAALLAIVANTGAGGAGAGGAGGAGTSNGMNNAAGGTDTAAVAAATTATQTNLQSVDQHGTIIAGMGGNGGNNNVAVGGAISAALVHTDPSTHIDTHTSTETVSNILTDVDHFGSIHGLGT